MKKTFRFLANAVLAFALIGLTGCPKPDDTEPEGGMEAKITSIEITNAGLSGGDIVKGVVDNTSFTVLFEGVAAETNITAVKLNAKCSLGAKLVKDVIDFTEGNQPDATELTREVTVRNSVTDAKGKEVVKEQVYAITIKLKPAEAAPVLEKMVIKDDQGTEHTLTPANIIDGILCLGVPESSTAEIVSVQLSPARGTYKFTTAENGVISASNPGMFEMEFLGLKAEYEISFAASPTPGANWSKAVVHDFSVATGNIYADFAGEGLDGEFTRGGDFDGQYVLIANRTAPKLLKLEDLLNDNPNNPILLDLTGVEGGTHVVSAGRLTQGHIYLCNLTTACGPEEPLKVYHYATPTSQPEIVLQWDGSGLENPDPDLYDEYRYAARVGDNISISLDEGGNGYAFFAKQEADNIIFRWTVTNFTQFSDPVELKMPAIANYYGMMNPCGPDMYLFKAHHKEVMWLMDHNGTMIRDLTWYKTPGGATSRYGCDPRVIEFNRARYIMLSNGRRFLYEQPEGINVWDISEGADMVSALVKLQEHLDYDEEDPVEGTSPIEPVYQYVMDSETLSTACVGLCNYAVVNGKLILFTAAPHAGFAIIEVPKAE